MKIIALLFLKNSKSPSPNHRIPELKEHIRTIYWDFSGGSVAETSCFQCMGPGFDFWSGNKTPCAAIKPWHRQIKIFLKILSRKNNHGKILINTNLDNGYIWEFIHSNAFYP